MPGNTRAEFRMGIISIEPVANLAAMPQFAFKAAPEAFQRGIVVAIAGAM